MDVTPPSTLRRLGIALAGLAVAALTGAACVLSFDDLRDLAVTGEARPDLAFLYPAAFDALLVVALIGLLLLRSAGLLARVQAAIVLVLLIVAAAAANVATAVRFVFDVRQTAIGVALAPWIMLAVALWLWLLMIKNVQGRRASRDDEGDDGTREPDIVPFHRGRPAETPPPLVPEAPAPVMEPTPLVGPTAAPETPPVPAQDRPLASAEEQLPVSARVTEWPAKELTHEPAQEPTHEPAEEQAHERAQDHAQKPVQEQEHAWAAAEPVHEDGEELAPEPETRPVRWGDRVKPTDVLVHPRPDVRDDSDDRDADTQPHPVFEEDEGVPDPLHGPEVADDGEPRTTADQADDHQADVDVAEQREEGSEDTTPHPAVHDDTPAPSGRLRSSPRPPED
ncbi:uncharacterized protein DUF2637 [Nonomuraea polychroma]|uniref:Uncharacterized protein DUF2637 n=1 Tax=Nonomuraea polychroma TaxID=46176 RepID=A0A438MN13_9ACTN|nr:DUF2637 domain-containing protein [Nonomuraea polychroma]RVX46995.1 uncharacterized protein DUF2637 [Nonomuraea polychroma]